MCDATEMHEFVEKIVPSPSVGLLSGEAGRSGTGKFGYIADDQMRKKDKRGTTLVAAAGEPDMVKDSAVWRKTGETLTGGACSLGAISDGSVKTPFMIPRRNEFSRAFLVSGKEFKGWPIISGTAKGSGME